MHKNELPSEFTADYWNLIVKIIWTYIYCVIWYVWTWMTSCYLEGPSPQLIIWTGKRSTRLPHENRQISQRATVEKLHWFSWCQCNYCGFGLKTVLHGWHTSLWLRWSGQNWKHVSDYPLPTKVWKIILWTALSQVMRVGCITRTQ